MTILLIDDDRLLRRAIERTLTKAGYSMTTPAMERKDCTSRPRPIQT
jgi:DNA-binding response OmpR family regulator